MKDSGKSLDTFNGEEPSFLHNFSASYDLPCRKHPSSGGGICAFCLRERLMELVCPGCGEQRLSSCCSCSENSSNPENVSVGRISFLLENEKPDLPKLPKIEILKRSNSSCVGVGVGDGERNKGGLWRIGRLLFRKRRQKGGEAVVEDSRSEMWVSDIVGVPRSRSLCSFRGGGVSGSGNGNGSLFYDTEESGRVSHSAARVSSVSGGFMMDSAKRSCFSESEARISNFDGRISNFEYEKDLIAKGIFSCSDDPKYIDLKLDMLTSSSSSSEVRGEYPVMRRGGLGSMRSNEYYGMMKNGSCRFSVSERELKKCRKSRKVWRWFFRASSKLG